MFVSITRLRLRSWLKFPRFFLHSNRSVAQAVTTPGFVEGATLVDRNLAFWTVTLWLDAASMKAFRGSGAHLAAMPLLAGWCDEAITAHWETEDMALPDWATVFSQMKLLGRLSPVDHATTDHTARQFPAPATGAWRTRPFKA